MRTLRPRELYITCLRHTGIKARATALCHLDMAVTIPAFPSTSSSSLYSEDKPGAFVIKVAQSIDRWGLEDRPKLKGY